MTVAAPKSKYDPYELRQVANRCDVEPKFFSIVPQEDGLTVFTANRDAIFTGPASQVKAFLRGVIRGCAIGRGLPRQQTLVKFPPTTQAPKPPLKEVPKGQRSLM